jgi:putative ABC transport system permease protein
MLKNYLVTAFRNLSRNKVFSFINIAGLSMGLACCMLIFLYTKDEISFDRFQRQKDKLYQITCTIINKDGKVEKYASAAMLQGPAFKQAIPAIEAFVRVNNNDEVVVKNGDESYKERVSWVDDNFFTVFTFPLIEGDPGKVLSDLHSIVLTDEMAKKYFGTVHAIGKTLELEINHKFEPFLVSGIAKRSPQNSSIKFNLLLPFKFHEKAEPENGWLWISYSTYFVIDPRADIKSVEASMDRVYATKAKTEIEAAQKEGDFNGKFVWGVRPFLKMHLDTEYQGDDSLGASNPVYSYILSGIAIFILLIACINFINLTVAQSLKRGKEIGIRKVVGGQRSQLIRQFLGESFVICFIAFGFAILLAWMALPVFDAKLVAGFIGLFLLTGFAAGFYPALMLSGFNPVQTLYNRTKMAGKNYLSKSLVVIQFALATFLIIATMFIYAQFNFLTHMDLGYNDKNLLVATVGQGNNKNLTEVFRNEFAKLPGVTMLAPRMQGEWSTVTKAGGKDFQVRYEHIDENYLPTLQIPMIEGRNFSSAFPADSTNSVLVNEAYVSAAGWKGSAIGKTVDFLNGQQTKLTIVGVVKDYHYLSLKDKIGPQLFSVDPKLSYGKFIMRVRPEYTQQTLKAVENIYRRLVPYHPLRYAFMEDLNFKNYEAEARWRQIITFSAILTIFISSIGLFGLSMLASEKRFKEIGVRKVLGASVSSLVRLLSTNFLTLVLIANIIAFPAAWWAVRTWLQNFAYRVPVSWWVFGAAAVLALSIALLTVSIQAIRAAVANPVKSLRTE